jgi:hypothetical protein
VSSEESEKKVEEIDASISIPVPKTSLKIELRFKREKLVLQEDIKIGEAKVFRSSEGWLLVRYDDKTKKLFYAFLDKKGRLREMGEL